MRNSVEEITKRGYSSLLFQLAERVGSGMYRRGSHFTAAVQQPYVSVTAVTDLATPKGMTIQRASCDSVRVVPSVNGSMTGAYGGQDHNPNNDSRSCTRSDQERRRIDGVVLNAEDLDNLSVEVTSISVKACDDYKREVLDLSRFTRLSELKIASKCFNYVSQVRIVGLLELQIVRIGEGSFQSNSKDSVLHIENCPSLLSLSIGNESFKSFSQWEMSGVKSLKSITMGCGCFRNANCILKDMESLKCVTLGDLCFEKSRHTVIESED